MEALWGQLRNSEVEPAPPDWHRDELERRDQMIQQGESHFIPWAKAKERIRNRVR